MNVNLFIFLLFVVITTMIHAAPLKLPFISKEKSKEKTSSASGGIVRRGSSKHHSEVTNSEKIKAKPKHRSSRYDESMSGQPSTAPTGRSLMTGSTYDSDSVSMTRSRSKPIRRPQQDSDSDDSVSTRSRSKPIRRPQQGSDSEESVSTRSKGKPIQRRQQDSDSEESVPSKSRGKSSRRSKHEYSRSERSISERSPTKRAPKEKTKSRTSEMNSESRTGRSNYLSRTQTEQTDSDSSFSETAQSRSTQRTSSRRRNNPRNYDTELQRHTQSDRYSSPVLPIAGSPSSPRFDLPGANYPNEAPYDGHFTLGTMWNMAGNHENLYYDSIEQDGRPKPVCYQTRAEPGEAANLSFEDMQRLTALNFEGHKK